MKNTTALAACLITLTLLFSQSTHAQSLKPEEIRAMMVADWERAKAYTNEYLNAMPADKYSLKAVDSIRSFAQQMLHLALGCYFLIQNASDEAPSAWSKSDLEHSPGAQQKDSVVYYVNAAYDYCIRAVKNTDVNKWGEKKKFFNSEVPRLTFMMKAFEHQTHHRGQTTIYIRLAGIRPPAERLFR